MLPVQFVFMGWVIGYVCGWIVFRDNEKFFAKMLMVLGVQMLIFFGSYLIGG